MLGLKIVNFRSASANESTSKGSRTAVFCIVLILLLTASLRDASTEGGEKTDQTLPYPKSEVTGGISLDWNTHQRFAQGSDNFQLTWAADDHLYGAWGDGGGFGGTNSEGRVGL